jgi:predicted RNase H-like nuclease (RuvC/YqgF family)
MTFWAKILTVVAFVLSLIFAAMSGTLYVTRDAWREKYDTLADTSEATIETLGNRLAESRQRSDERARKINDLETQLATQRDLKETAQQKNTQLEEQIAAFNAKWAEYQETLKEQVEATQVVTALNEKLTDRANEVKEENIDLRAQITTLKGNVSELQSELANLQKNHDDVRAELADARTLIEHHGAIFAELKNRNVETRDVIEGLLAMPAISGKVIAVDLPTNTVVLNVGKESNVRKAQVFKVYRGPRYVCDVTIFDVSETRCAAEIMPNRMNLNPEIGDEAATRLSL